MPVQVHAEHTIENDWDNETRTGLSVTGYSGGLPTMHIAGKKGLLALRQVIADLQKLEEEFKQFIPEQSD